MGRGASTPPLIVEAMGAVDPRPPAPPPRDALDLAARRRLERDRELPTSERLARMHALCKQMTTLTGAARRR